MLKRGTKLQVIVVEIESLKQMVAKLEDKVRECKKAWLSTNECSNKIDLIEASKEILGTMMQDVNEVRNVCTLKSWIHIYGSDVVSNSLGIMYVINQEKNVESVDVQELK